MPVEEHTLFSMRSARTFIDCGYTMTCTSRFLLFTPLKGDGVELSSSQLELRARSSESIRSSATVSTLATSLDLVPSQTDKK